ncbi:Ig-like domain-containing protein [Tenacibaculum halocynthiae]|uniref:Ig-like domain-containing protein n=1 Tax=Tenacibaculum halocynthiae TaxID=1254437 RepID=UPI003892F249
MKSLSFILFTLLSYSILGQVNPKVNFASPSLVKGTGEVGATINISKDSDLNTIDYTVIVDDKGKFSYTFNPALTAGDFIVIWSVDSNNIESQKIHVEIEKENLIIQRFNDGEISTRGLTNLSLAGTTMTYKATILNTNFSIPLARFNFTKNTKNKTGDLLLFNSIGAGFGFSAGELSETRDSKGELINQEFVNTFGMHLGFLFSAGTGDDAKNVFAPTLNVSVLDFQIGLGYELGTLTDNQKPIFLTLSYAIPLYKLKKGGFWIWKGPKPIGPMDSRHGK